MAKKKNDPKKAARMAARQAANQAAKEINREKEIQEIFLSIEKKIQELWAIAPEKEQFFPLRTIPKEGHYPSDWVSVFMNKIMNTETYNVVLLSWKNYYGYDTVGDIICRVDGKERKFKVDLEP